VKVVSSSHWVSIGCASYIGQVGTLLRDDGSDVPYKVEFPDGYKAWFQRHDLVSHEDTEQCRIVLDGLCVPMHISAGAGLLVFKHRKSLF
jgi:hypothetical protein